MPHLEVLRFMDRYSLKYIMEPISLNAIFAYFLGLLPDKYATPFGVFFWFWF